MIDPASHTTPRPVPAVRVRLAERPTRDPGARIGEGDVNAVIARCGLIERRSAIVPLRADTRRRWNDTVRRVLTDGEPRYFPMHRPEGLCVIGLTTDDHRAEVRVHLPDDALCSRAALARLGELVAATPRERDVLECLAAGLAPAEIAERLGTRLSTVRTQIKSVLVKTDVSGMRSLLQFLARLPDV